MAGAAVALAFCLFALAAAAAANDQWRFQLVAAAAVHTAPSAHTKPSFSYYPSIDGDRHPAPNGTACEIAAAMRIASTEKKYLSRNKDGGKTLCIPKNGLTIHIIQTI